MVGSPASPTSRFGDPTRRADPLERSAYRWGLVKRGGIALVDQVLSSGSALLLLVLVARQSSAATFGAVSIALIVHGSLLGCGRALVGDVALIRCRREGVDPRQETGTGLVFALGWAALAAAGVLLASRIVHGDVGLFLAWIALAIPFVYVQDLIRYVSYGHRESRLAVREALLLDGVWVGVQALLSGMAFLLGEADAPTLVAAWVAGAALSAVLGCARGRRRPRLAGVRRWLQEDRARMGAFLSDYTISTGLVQLSFLVLAGLLSLPEFGRFRLAHVAVSPLANAMAGVRLLTFSRLAGRQGTADRALRAAGQMAAAFVAVSVVYAVALAVIPVSWGTTALGATWSGARDVAVIIALGEVFRLGAFPLIDLVKIIGSPALLVRRRAVVAFVVVVATLVGGSLREASGAAVGTACGMVLAAAVWVGAARAARSAPAGAEPGPLDGEAAGDGQRCSTVAPAGRQRRASNT